MTIRVLYRWLVLVGATGAVCLIAPRPPASGAVGSWLLDAPPDLAISRLAAAAAWACLCWVTLALALVVVARTPGVVGRAGAAISRRVIPRGLRLGLEAAVGVSIVAAPVVAPAAAFADHGDPAPTVPSLDRPVAHRAPSVPSNLLHAAHYVVQPGDCLWSIAREHLRPRAGDSAVATAWPRWYAANRHVIGPDPDVLQPGQQLVVPPDGASR
jgi:nucleoid-associated protein YgaU